jgi:hypothetical protein
MFSLSLLPALPRRFFFVPFFTINALRAETARDGFFFLMEKSREMNWKLHL